MLAASDLARNIKRAQSGFSLNKGNKISVIIYFPCHLNGGAYSRNTHGTVLLSDLGG
jgi:hypothetical protein